MHNHDLLSNLSGAVLVSMTFMWKDGTAELVVRTPLSPGDGSEVLRFTDVTRLVAPREGQWREVEGIADIHGPFFLDKDTCHLRIVMNSCDAIELDFRALELVRGEAATPITCELSPASVELPHLHDAELVDVRLRWSDGAAELLVGPLTELVQESLGASHVLFRFGGVKRVRCPRLIPWGSFSVDILDVLGPIKLGEACWHLRIRMQDGDVLEFDNESVEFVPASPSSPGPCVQDPGAQL